MLATLLKRAAPFVKKASFSSISVSSSKAPFLRTTFAQRRDEPDASHFHTVGRGWPAVSCDETPFSARLGSSSLAAGTCRFTPRASLALKTRGTRVD
jgi:hypothetical protein